MPQEKGQGQSQAVDSLEYLSQPAHSLPFESVINELRTSSEDGLTSEGAKQNLDKYGENMLEGDKGVSLAEIFIRQIANAMMLVSKKKEIKNL